MYLSIISSVLQQTLHEKWDEYRSLVVQEQRLFHGKLWYLSYFKFINFHTFCLEFLFSYVETICV